MSIARNEILKRLKQKIKNGQPIIGAGAGTGISAKCEEVGGVDLIVIYNSGRFRMAGRGSLAGNMPYGDANAIVMDMAGEVLTIVENTPVLAGVCGTDPFRSMNVFLKEVKEIGFSGVQNFPTVGLMDGMYRQNLEETGMSYNLEVEMIRKAVNMDLLTTPYVFNTEEAQKMAEAGADIIVAHMGLTSKGSIGAQTTMSLEEASERVGLIVEAACKENPNVITLCHGGPISEPDDAAYVLKAVNQLNGFYGASSMERLPTEVAITEQVRQFTNLSIKR